MNIEFKGDFFDKLKKINKHSFLRRMTDEAGVIAVNFSKDRFIYKNWIDKSVKKWSYANAPIEGRYSSEQDGSNARCVRL